MTEFINVSDLIPEHSGLKVCLSDTTPVQILQWQCKGEPIADIQRGDSDGRVFYSFSKRDMCSFCTYTRIFIS